MEQCKNCEAVLTGPYCSQCGQKALAERITLGYIIRSFVEAITNLEQGFWYTMRELISRPGVVAAEYLEGKRQRYFHPVRYLLILVTAVTVVSLASGVYDLQQNEIQHLQNQALGLQPDDKYLLRQQKVQEESKKYLNLIAMATLPFVSFVGYRLFRKKRYNYAEHLAIVAFWSAQLAAIGMVVQFAFLVAPGAAAYALPANLLIGSLYFGVGYRQLFNIGHGQAFAKGLLANLLGFLLMMASVIVITIVAVLAYKFLFK